MFEGSCLLIISTTLSMVPSVSLMTIINPFSYPTIVLLNVALWYNAEMVSPESPSIVFVVLIWLVTIFLENKAFSEAAKTAVVDSEISLISL